MDRLAIEIDGMVKYTDPEALRAEKTREDDLRAAGLAFHRAWADDVFRDPAGEMQRLAAKHEQMNRHGLALPA